MRTIVILRPAQGADLQSIVAVLPREEPALWASMAEGSCRAAYYNEAVPGSVVLEYETADFDTARKLVESLPLVAEGLQVPEYCPLRPYTGLSLMFRGEFGFAPTPPASWFA